MLILLFIQLVRELGRIMGREVSSEQWGIICPKIIELAKDYQIEEADELTTDSVTGKSIMHYTDKH